MVARFVRDEEAVGSNPATPTRKSAGQKPVSLNREKLAWLLLDDPVSGLGENWETILTLDPKIVSENAHADPLLHLR